MKFEKTISLTAYEVEYIDQRQPKPRTVQRETVVLDGGRICALQRLGMRPAGYIAQQMERSGYTVSAIRKGETINASVDLAALWQNTVQAIQENHAEKENGEIPPSRTDLVNHVQNVLKAASYEECSIVSTFVDSLTRKGAGQ